MRGIDAAAVSLPRYRLAAEEVEETWGTAPRGIESMAVPAADEDALTMAIAASETMFENTEHDRETVEFICLGTTTPPLEEGMCAPRLGRALGVGRNVETTEHTQSTLAGAEALARALDASGPALVVTADCPEDDTTGGFGAGAVAFLVTDDARVAVEDRAWHMDEYPGLRYRERGSQEVESLGITTYERSATRECVAGAVSKLTDMDYDAAALHQPDARMPGRIARDLPLDSDAVGRGTVVNRIGDAGAATVPIGLARALATADSEDRTLAGFFGSGGAGAAFAFKETLAVSGLDDGDLPTGKNISYSTFLRKRGRITTDEITGGGARVSLPTWRRTLDQRDRLLAGRCPECGEFVFPPEGACQNCHSRVEFEPVELPRIGTVEARTVVGQGGAPPEFAALQRRDGSYGVAIIGFDMERGHVTMPGQLTDCDPETVEVGDSVRATVRRIYEQEGVVRYGAKFIPVE